LQNGVVLGESGVPKRAINSSDFVLASRGCNAVLRDFDFGDSAKGEEQLDQIGRRILGRLAHDVADCGGYGRVEQHASRLQSGEIHAHCLSRLKGSHNLPRFKLWASCALIANPFEQPTKFLVEPVSCRQFFTHPGILKEPAGRRRYSILRRHTPKLLGK
jgi:hypothetical protein